MITARRPPSSGRPQRAHLHQLQFLSFAVTLGPAGLAASNARYHNYICVAADSHCCAACHRAPLRRLTAASTTRGATRLAERAGRDGSHDLGPHLPRPKPQV